MRRKVFISGAAVAIIVAIVVGLLTVGGPIEARREAYDLRRYNDLARISQALWCPNLRIQRPILPNDLSLATIRAYCGGTEIQADVLWDEETQKPYRYERISESQFSVCADFYDAEKTMRLTGQLLSVGAQASFNPDTGCVTGRVE